MPSQPTRESARAILTTAGVGAAAVVLAAAAAAPALADSHADSGDNGNHYGQSKDHSNNGHHGAGNSNGNGSSGSDTGSDAGADSGHNPAGNNGTVKIHDDYGDPAHHNVPHVDCDFAVAFWGFDAGQDLDVSFAGQAPTGKDVPLTVTGAATSITSPDDAGGGQDPDGELDFTADQLNLSSLGDPHPQQGYHIKLTVDTGEPGGHKYKVFWLQPCAAPAATSESGTTTETPQSSTPQSDTPETDVLGETATTPDQSTAGTNANAAMAATKHSSTPTEVLGRHITRSPSSAAAPAAASLPFTGAEIGELAAAAALTLGAGTALTIAGRRRRRTGTVSGS